jgi:hypothetical protein
MNVPTKVPLHERLKAVMKTWMHVSFFFFLATVAVPFFCPTQERETRIDNSELRA